ncbi:TerD family protein [Gordonia amicalis]|uniref:TerD family protein n=1 Tax=Gordonia amicalis TaxID=89053 RepID=UPI0022A6EF79|nr:TerD family protein [Gordonia amicalis]MCZ0912244.1 TerD family protein [Gordonia amicalis]MCZ4653926.1 TerD family protein [Gordonia amicalis]
MTVVETVNTAFSDNPAAGCAVGLEGSTLSIVMRQQDIEALPDQSPGTTSSGTPTLKKLTKRDRVLWWLHILTSNLVATCREAYAVAPGISRVNVAVITRFPETLRLGVALHGSWSRAEIESTPWRTADDALRILDLGSDVESCVRTTASGNLSTTLKPLDIEGVEALASLLADAQDDASSRPLAELDSELGDSPEPVTEISKGPYELRPFERWLSSQSLAGPTIGPIPTLPPDPIPASRPVGNSDSLAVVALTAGQNQPIPEAGVAQFDVVVTFAGCDADLSFLLLDQDGQVGSDHDFVFYNQRSAPDQSARLNGKRHSDSQTTEWGTIHPLAVRPDVHRVLVVATADPTTGVTLDALDFVEVSLACSTTRWVFRPDLESGIRAVTLAEIYRRPMPAAAAPVGPDEQWKLRAIGQGWRDGLAGLARDHGVDVDD